MEIGNHEPQALSNEEVETTAAAQGPCFSNLRIPRDAS